MRKKAMFSRVSIAMMTAIVLANVCTVSLAQNMSFMRESPIAWMDDSDKAVLEAAVDALLEQPDGTVSDWSNEDATAQGRLKVFDTHEDYGTTCRNIKMLIEAQGRKDGGVVRLCKAADDSWKFAPTRESLDESAEQ